jgi:hypothetical protein
VEIVGLPPGGAQAKPSNPNRARNIRVGILLAILAGCALEYLRVWQAENWVPDWETREQAAVVVLVPPDLTEEEAEVLQQIEAFAFDDGGQATFKALTYWFQREYGRYAEEGVSPVYLDVVGPVKVQTYPPAPPRVGANLSFLQRYQQTKAFLDYFRAKRESLQFAPENAVFVLFYKAEQGYLFKGIHSVASRRDRSGFVFAPLTQEGADTALINTAHELLHLYGASDQYDGERCVYPEGFYEPLQQPRFPQRYAEVMAQGIPVADGRKEASLELFEDMRVGVHTAYEIGWIDQARRDRYYAGDASAGPREEVDGIGTGGE